ncbi:peptidylprolyl isomerase [Rhodopseudomonas palustris]|uniref:Parvulin-like PPIase n=1 Tax=Rhodopseudomonas palustris (strain BisB18) TaxID=316056 RepID=Q213A4_RHOPB
MNKYTITAGMLVALAASTPAAMAQTRTPLPPAPVRSTAVQPAAAPAQPTTAHVTPAQQPSSSVAKGGEIVARIGENDITAEEVRAAISFLDARQQAALARDPAQLSQTVRAILANRLALKEALAKKWDQQPVIVAQLARVRESQIVESYLQSLTTPPESYPNESEIKAVYDANASALMVPRRFQLAQIVVAVAKDADKAAEDAGRKKLDDVLKKAKAPGADFAALARSVSDDAATAERDGEIGWAAEPDLKTEIRSQIVGLAKGAISEPVRLDDGWHILKLLDTEASRLRSLSEVRDALVQRIRAERADANRRAYMAELLKQTPPVINEIALSKLLEAKPDATSVR